MSDNTLMQQFLTSCTKYFGKKLRSFYIQAKESMGQPKRTIVVSHVEDACHSLEETKVHFENALLRFKDIILIDDTTLDNKYRLLQQQYDFCKAKADHVSHRIQAIEEVTEALFNEWETELTEYSNKNLKTKSRQQLRESKRHYSKLIKSMKKAESKINPVLAAFKDQVLFLKHNLNAQAIAAIENEFLEIGGDVTLLIQVMEQTIYEANQFVASLLNQKALPNHS